MANYAALKAAIQDAIKTNDNNEINGALLQQSLVSIINSLGAGYQFVGVATPATNPGTPDQNVAYLAGPGIYPNFNSAVIDDGTLGILKYNGSWEVETIEGVGGGGGSSLTGYVTVDSINNLPDPGEPTLGYLIGTNLYLYVGEGGDTLDGKYQNCGPFRGPQGEPGTPAIGFQDVTSAEDGTIVITLTSGDTVTIDLNHEHPGYYSKISNSTQPSDGFLPDTVYNLGTITGTVTFSLAAAVSGNINHYYWMFDTDSTAPTITWPTGITWAKGSVLVPAASKHYEISILNGIAIYLEV